MTSFETALFRDAKAVEAYLSGLPYSGAEQALLAAERYSLLAGGKRIRPVLVMETCRMFGGAEETALPFAAAVEMVHTYSLIHDDLPCMDDDDLRRGKPTNHKVHGEATALLAGDALLTDAFGVLAGNTAVPAALRVEAVRVLSDAAGSCGMVSGQILDMAGEKRHLAFEELLRLHRLKTGALIRAAVELGCLAAGVVPEDSRFSDAVRYAEGIGLVFQMIDDVLDATATAEVIGKSVGGDAAHGKTTFLTFGTADEVLREAEQITAASVEALSAYPDREILTDLAFYLLKRKK